MSEEKSIEELAKEKQKKLEKVDGVDIQRMDAEPEPMPRLHSGSYKLDNALGGGWPEGRLVEVYGPPSGGKTTIALEAAKAAQEEGKIVGFVDAEHGLDKDYASSGNKDIEGIGVNLEAMLISQPESGENALHTAESMVKEDVELVIIDSVAALTPQAELDGDIDDDHVGLQARLMSQHLRTMKGKANAHDVLVMYINQIRMKIGVMFGCFSYQTSVLMEDGSYEYIGPLVNQQKSDRRVMSYDPESGLIEPKEITDHFKQGVPVETFDQSQREIENIRQEYQTLVYRYPNKRGHHKVVATPNHEIATPNGYRQMQDIGLDDKVLARHDTNEYSEDLKSLILGSILGDASLRSQGKMTAYMREEHVDDQKEYVNWKSDMLSNGLNVEQMADGYEGYRTETSYTLGRFNNLFYKDNNRYKDVVEVLNNIDITPLVLAIWYQDDGTRSDESGSRSRNVITMHDTSNDEAQTIKTRIEEKYDLNVKVYHAGHTTRIHFDGENAKRFEDIIKPYVHPSMKYKLRDKNGVGSNLDNLSFFSEKTEEAIECRVYEKRRRIKEGKKAVRYNLEVEDNSSYIVGDTIVHNSPETTPGGKSLKFYSSIRLRLSPSSHIKEDGKKVGQDINARVNKNKTAPPFKKETLRIRLGAGLDKAYELANYAIDHGVIEQAGAWIKIGDDTICQGESALIDMINKNDPVNEDADDIESVPMRDRITKRMEMYSNGEIDGYDEKLSLSDFNQDDK